MNVEELKIKSEKIRRDSINYRIKTKSAHIGSDLSAIEILTTLYHNIMGPKDTFILSKGHGSGALYAVLMDLGKIPEQDYHKLSHHPDINPKYGISATTGSLGHGLSIGLGMAFASPPDVYVLLGDGECDEGQVWEAADMAKRLNVGNLVAIVDCNGWQGYKKSQSITTLKSKFEAFGWTTYWGDGHNHDSLIKGIKCPRKNFTPHIVLAETIKGKGLEGGLEGTLESHYQVPKEQ
jgi:transketolase